MPTSSSREARPLPGETCGQKSKDGFYCTLQKVQPHDLHIATDINKNVVLMWAKDLYGHEVVIKS